MIFPCPKKHLNNFIYKVKSKKPFSFIRFSDGEIEVLRNRYLEIKNGKTLFRGSEFTNNFPMFDTKKFDPNSNQDIRKDLLGSALFRGENFYKGIPTFHNNALQDREFLIRLNGGVDPRMTFSDLFLNNNYKEFRKKLVPLFNEYDQIYIIANYRAKPINFLKRASHIKIPDNFFLDYKKTLSIILEQLEKADAGALVLSSASSLSNIIGYKLYGKDITFMDIGTSINDLLSLDNTTREYHGSKSFIKKFFYEGSRRHNIKW